MKSVILAGLVIVLSATLVFAESVTLNDPILTSSIIRDDLTAGGGATNYINDEGGISTNIWFGLNTKYRIDAGSWDFQSKDGSQSWTATFIFSGTEIADNAKYSVYVPTNEIVNGWNVTGGVITSCEWGDPLWANLNASLNIGTNAGSTDCSFSMNESLDQATGITYFSGQYIANGVYAVPEPGTIALLIGALGAGAVILLLRRK